MNENPLVSVIVPTKNSAQFLDTCLKSLLVDIFITYNLVCLAQVISNTRNNQAKNQAKTPTLLTLAEPRALTTL